MPKNIKAPWWDKAISHLSENDKILKKIISEHKESYLQYRGDPFKALCRTIIGQQISVKAADSVWKNIELNITEIKPHSFLDYGIKNIKKCGTSEKKAEYLFYLANHFIKNKNFTKNIEPLSDEKVKKELCNLKGIGPWSAEMFLMFCLLRPDILPIGALGLRKAIGLNYFNKKLPSDEEIGKISHKWKPYRSAATWLLWRSIDPITIDY